MKVRRIDANGDWTFGQGLANYIIKAPMVRQNVVTRIKSFKFDWFLDVDAEIDWFNIIGSRNNEKTILSELERVVLATTGVRTIDRLRINGITKRDASIELIFTTIYDVSFTENIGIAI
ncbi:hypothetical protein [Sulfurovum sp.]|uniref:hypothetical protein n=1 Tax=Sulfurovum sp. TaxID=1969726 RepID=UPI0035674B56